MIGVQQHIKDRFNIKDDDYNKIKLLFLYSFALGFFIAFYFVPANSKFLENYGHFELPYAYIISGIVGIFAITVYSFIQKHKRSKTLFVSAIVFMLIISLLSKVFLVLLENNILNLSFDLQSALTRTISFFVFIWAWPFIALVATITGGLALRLFNLLQVKKFYGLINLGGVIAATISYFLISQILKLLNSQYDLILIGVFGLVAAIILLFYIYKKFPEKPKEKIKVKKQDKFKLFGGLLKNKFIFFIFLGAIASSVVIYITDYGFLISVKATKDEILGGDQGVASFLSLVFGGLKVGELIISLVSGRILTKGGLKLGLILLPLFITLLFLTAFLSAETVGVVSILFLALMTTGKMFERIIRRGVDDPSFNVLYQTLEDEQKLYVQTRVGLVQQGTIAIAGTFLLLVNLALQSSGSDFKVEFYPLYALPLMVIAIYIALQLYSKYKNRIKEILAEKKLFKLEYIEQEIFANDILKKFILSEDLEASKFSTVVLSETNPRSLENYIAFLLKVDDLIIRKAILSNIDSTYNEKLVPIIEEVGNKGGIKDRELKKLFLKAFFKLDYSEIKQMTYDKLRSFAYSENPQLNITATKYLFKTEISNDEDLIIHLLNSKDRSVKLAAIKIAGKRKTPRLWVKLIELLDNPEYNNIIVNMLIEIGEPILDDLNNFFKTQTDVDVLSKIIQIYSKIGTKKAQKILVSYIDYPNREVQNKCIMSLHYSRFTSENDTFDIIKNRIKSVAYNIFWFLISIKDLVREKNTLRLVQALDLERTNSLEELFVLLSFTQSPEIVDLIKTNIIGENTIFALELIDNYIEPEIKKMIIPLFEPITIGQKVKRLKPFFELKPLDFEQRLIDIVLTDNVKVDIWSQSKAIELIGRILPKTTTFKNPASEIPEIFEPTIWDNKSLNKIKLQFSVNKLEAIIWVAVLHPSELIFASAMNILYEKAPDDLKDFVQKLSERKIKIYENLVSKSDLISDKIKILRRVYLFYSVPEKSLIKLADIAHRYKLSKDETVSFYKEEQEDIIIIVKGKLILNQNTKNETTFNKNSIVIRGLNAPIKTEKLTVPVNSIIIKINRFKFFNLLASNNNLIQNLFKTMKF